MADEVKVEPVATTVDFYSNESDVTFKTLEECQQYLGSIQRQTFLLDRSQFTDIKLGKDKDNKVTIDFGQGELPLDRTGFSRICKITKSPESYVASLPLENIRKDIVARLLTNPKTLKLNFIVKNGHVVGATTRENTLSSREFVERAFQTNHKIFKSLGVSNERLFVDFIVNEESPLPNDVFGFGLSCQHDDSTGGFPTVSPFSFRMVCSNGAIHTKTLGKIRFSARMSADKMFEALAQKFVDIPSQLSAKYRDSLHNMNNYVIEADEKPFIRDYLSDTLGWEDGIDGSVQYDEQITNKGDANYYGLMNFITNYANQLDLRSRREIQMMAGNMFDYFGGGNHSNELFAGYAEFKRRKMADAN